MGYRFAFGSQVVETGNLAQFCRDNALSYTGMRRLIRGDVEEYKGWKLADDVEPVKYDRRGRRGKIFSLVSPDNDVYRVDNLSRFCAEHGLVRNSVRLLTLGAASQHKGWRLAPKEDENG